MKTLATLGLSSTSQKGLITGGLVSSLGSVFIRRAFLIVVPIPEFFSPVIALPFCPPEVVVQAESLVQVIAMAEQELLVTPVDVAEEDEG